MTISTHTRVERGYYRRYYERTAEMRRLQQREYYRWRCLRGWVNWLLAELRNEWAAEAMRPKWPLEMLSGDETKGQMTDQPTPDSQATWDLLTSYVCAGRNRRSTGLQRTRIQSTG